jgi:hypothetical protein
MSYWISSANIDIAEARIWLLEYIGEEHNGWHTTGGFFNNTGWIINKHEDALAFKLRFVI